MSSFDFSGIGVAMATPFDPTGKIDFNLLDSHVDYLIDNGVDYIVALGTTAETPTLTSDEYTAVHTTVLKRVAGRVPVILGLGGNNTAAIVEKISSIGSCLNDFAAILSVTPYYNKPSQEGLYRHFAAIAKASPVPVVLYNVPGRTGVNMEAATTLRLATDFPGRIAAIKEASGKLDQIAEIIAGAPEGFKVISGDDALALPMIRLGASGVISVLGNALPATFGRLIHSALNGDNAEADTLQDRLSALYPLLFRDGNPSGIKALLALNPSIGYPEVLRLPLVPVTTATRAAIAEELRKLNEISH
ncbi:MAG: 4-hydroxy-tetrahydrodipicolinate synthase [Duncaniella sp.]|nr:4-hydroxy-tetrahydrodipicolinate synthase [Duncaniella sp.]